MCTILTTEDRNSSIFDKKKLDDPTQLILMFEVTDLVGIVSLLYGMLLHSGAPLRRDMAPCELSVQTLAITTDACVADNRMSLMCRFPQEQWVAAEQCFRVAL
ncbi:hypothetical protein ACOMHN_017049 [Nucella lapillus]